MQQEGRTATNPQTGERVVMRGGQWVPLDGAAPAAPAGPRVIPGTRPQPMATPQAPAVERNTQVNTERTQREMPTIGVPTGVERPNGGAATGIPGSPYGAADSGLRWNRDGTGLEPIPGFQRPAPPPDPAQAAARNAKLLAADNIERQLNRIREVYSRSFEGWGPGSFVNSILPTSANQQFSAVSDALAIDLKSLIRGPGEGTWTDADQAMLEQLTPRPGHWDSRNEEVFRELQARIDAVRQQYGGPPVPEVPNGADGTNQSRAVYMPPTAPQSEPDNQAATRDIEDPVRRGHAMEIAGMMNDLEIGEREILDYHARNFPGEDPAGLRMMLERRRDPNSNERRAMQQGVRPFAPDRGWFTSQRDATGLEQTLGAVLDTGAGTAATNYLNGAMGGWLPDAAGAVGLDSETVRAGMEGQRAQNPMHALAGDVTGAIGAYGAAGQVARNFNVLQNMPRTRALLGDTAYGASYGAGSNSGGLDERLNAAAVGATLQGVGGVAAREGTRVLGDTARGVSAPAVQRMREAGDPLTLGNTVGQSGVVGETVRGLENAATSLPGVGRQITARHMEARAVYNRRTWNEALQSIGGTVGQRVGEEAAENAAQQVSQVYQRAFQGRTFRLDRAGTRDLASAERIAAGAPTHGEALQRLIANEVRPLLQAGDVQAAHRLIREYRADFAGMADGRRAATLLGRLQANVEGMIRRQHPQAMRDLSSANRAYRRIAILQRAQGAAVNNGDAPGLFTPAQVGRASRDGTRQYGGRAESVSTRRPFYQSQRDAQNVLPSNIPNSGTGDRLAAMALLGTAVGGAEYAGLPGMEGGAGLLGGLALLYSRGGQGAANALLAARPQAVRDVANQATRQYIQLPGRLQPFLPPVTLPQLSGTVAGTSTNSLLGLQSEYRD